MQLSKLRLVYCEHGGSSAAVREFIGSDKIINWAKEHPHVNVSVEVRNGHHPFVEGQYVSGKPKVITVKNETSQELKKVMDMLYNSSGRKITKLRKPVITATPSIQGVWTPMLHLQDTPFQVKFIEE
jgi:large subunit ribosomal protein L43